MASLIIGSGDKSGEYFPLGQRTTVIGRDEGVPLQILDERVSRKHAQVRFDDKTQAYVLMDMKSVNGTFVNGRRLTTELVLSDGDEITLGDTRLMFTLADFSDKAGALAHFKKVGERKRSTLMR